MISMMIIISAFIATCVSSNPEDHDQEIIGTWKLQEWTSVLPDSTTVFPFGAKAFGKLIYEPNGEMMAFFMADARGLFTNDSPAERDPQEALSAFNSFFAYSGPYELNKDSSFVIHTVEACSNPNWINRKQTRYYYLSGDSLILTTPPIRVQGTMNNASVQKLTWLREPKIGRS